MSGSTVGVGIILTFVVIALVNVCIGEVRFITSSRSRADGVIQTLTDLSPCDGGYNVKHYDAGTFACVDLKWIEVKP